MVRCSLIVVLLVGAGARADDAKSLDGRWKLTAVEAEGKTIEPGDNPPRWVIQGGKVHYAGDLLAEITVLPGNAPRGIDIAWVKPKRVYEGVFSLDGDTLKVCVNHQTEGARNRPQDLKTEGNADFRLLTFRRDKAENPDPLEGVNGFAGIMIGLNDNKQVVVTGTIAGSPAEKAGLKKDDLLTSVAGVDASDLQTVVAAVRRQKPGDSLVVKFQRDGKDKELTVKVGKMPFFYLD